VKIIMKKIFLILLCATAGSSAMEDSLPPEAEEPISNCRCEFPNALMSAGLVSTVGGSYCLAKAFDSKCKILRKATDLTRINPETARKYLLAGIALKTAGLGLLASRFSKKGFDVSPLGPTWHVLLAESVSTPIGFGLYALETAYLKYHHAKKEYHMIRELRQQEALNEFAQGASFIMIGLFLMPLVVLECD
jgi:hypothetical protein